ncbi:MAG: hypothetical protein ACI9UQ_000215 [Candidatus Krumholzibacteriia bacterium]|jgi:hypothetical protein
MISPARALIIAPLIEGEFPGTDIVSAATGNESTISVTRKQSVRHLFLFDGAEFNFIRIPFWVIEAAVITGYLSARKDDRKPPFAQWANGGSFWRSL